MLRWSNFVLVLLVVAYANAGKDFKQNRNMWNDAMTGGSVWLLVRHCEVLREKGPKHE